MAARLLGTAQDLVAGTAFGPYTIQERIGQGGMGVVYRALHATLARPVALKIMRSELAGDAGFLERFLREARVAATVDHPCLVRIYDAGRQDGMLFMAFEFVPGGDLEELIAARGQLDWEAAVRLVDDCAQGLAAIHAAGLVHRDLKPRNVFITAAGCAKVGDFGLARSASGDDRMTATGLGLGTPAYMSPEQAHGHGDLDIRSDLYGLGCVLYAALTGKAPYQGQTSWMIVNQVCNDPAPDPRALRPDLPEELANLVLRAMAKRREDRYQDPAELRADLARLLPALSGRAATSLAPADPAGRPPLAMPPGTLDLLLGPAVPWWWATLAGLTVALALLPLALCPGLQLPRLGAWPYDEPGLWGIIALLTTIAAGLLWVPLRTLHIRLAAAGRAGVRRSARLPLGALDAWPGLAAGVTAAGLMAVLLGGALCALFRWSGPAWDGCVLAGGAAAAAAWLTVWWTHPLRGDPLALARRHLPRLAITGCAQLALALFCHLLVRSRLAAEPAIRPSRSALESLRDSVRGLFKPPLHLDAPAILDWPTTIAVSVGIALVIALLVPVVGMQIVLRKRTTLL